MSDETLQNVTPKKNGLSVAQIESALNAAHGNVSLAARALGVARMTVYRHIEDSPTLRTVLGDAREFKIDFAEDKLFEAVEAGDMTAIIWTLKASPEAKRRGWGEKQEITGANNDPLKIVFTWADDNNTNPDATGA